MEVVVIHARNADDGSVRLGGLVLPVALVLLFLAFRVGICLPNLNAHVLKIGLGPGVEIRPALADPKSPNGEQFDSMVRRLKPYAAINGTFYDENYKPLGDVIINGRRVNRGHYRNAIAFTYDGKVEFLHSSKRLSWTGYKAGLAAGPRLVHRGRITLDPVADGFSRRSLSLSALRSGVGITADNKLLLVTTKRPMTFEEFAEMMKDLGAVEAMNLDGGSACGMYYAGKLVAYPVVPMTNILMVCKKR